MTEKPKTGKQRKKYRVITAVIAALLTIFVFAACFLTIKSVNDFIYMTQRRQDALDVAEAGGFKAVNEKIILAPVSSIPIPSWNLANPIPSHIWKNTSRMADSMATLI